MREGEPYLLGCSFIFRTGVPYLLASSRECSWSTGSFLILLGSLGVPDFPELGGSEFPELTTPANNSCFERAAASHEQRESVGRGKDIRGLALRVQSAQQRRIARRVSRQTYLHDEQNRSAWPRPPFCSLLPSDWDNTSPKRTPDHRR